MRNKRKPNWLFRGLIGVSLVVHVFVFMHISGIYRSRALSYIELSMQDVSGLVARHIPRPRLRPKAPEVTDVTKPMIAPRPLPNLKPMKVDPVDTDFSDTLMESIAVPDVPETTGLGVADWAPHEAWTGGAEDFLTAQSYLEMVRLRIERYKKYPMAARNKNIEGRVTIQFVITPSGAVREAHITTPTRNQALNTAALDAVRDAAPFPIPPKRFFDGDLPLELTIVFELT